MSIIDTTTINWKNIVFGSGWLQQLDRLASRRFGKGGLAEEASTYVIEQLSENNWAMLEGFKGQCKPESYLYTLTGNCLEEFSRKRFGRPRPPEWLKRNGELWVQIWKWICLEREALESVVDKACVNAIREPRMVKEIVYNIKAKVPSCGESNKEVSTSKILKNQEEEFSLEDTIPDFVTPDSEMETNHYREVLLLLSSLLQEDNDGNDDTEIDDDLLADFSYKFRQLSEHIELSDEERIIMRMVYQDGLKMKTVADALSMPEHQPGRIVKRVLDRVKNALEELDIALDEIREIAA